VILKLPLNLAHWSENHLGWLTLRTYQYYHR